MSAWMKTKLTSGKAHLWVRVDGDWKDSPAKRGCFDNMNDRAPKGTTDWTRYDLVVDVPPTSKQIGFGGMLDGTGEMWVDDISFEEVSKSVPLTGEWIETNEPGNLGFEENAKDGNK